MQNPPSSCLGRIQPSLARMWGWHFMGRKMGRYSARQPGTESLADFALCASRAELFVDYGKAYDRSAYMA